MHPGQLEISQELAAQLVARLLPGTHPRTVPAARALRDDQHRGADRGGDRRPLPARAVGSGDCSSSPRRRARGDGRVRGRLPAARSGAGRARGAVGRVPDALVGADLGPGRGRGPRGPRLFRLGDRRPHRPAPRAARRPDQRPTLPRPGTRRRPHRARGLGAYVPRALPRPCGCGTAWAARTSSGSAGRPGRSCRPSGSSGTTWTQTRSWPSWAARPVSGCWRTRRPRPEPDRARAGGRPGRASARTWSPPAAARPRGRSRSARAGAPSLRSPHRCRRP